MINDAENYFCRSENDLRQNYLQLKNALASYENEIEIKRRELTEKEEFFRRFDKPVEKDNQNQIIKLNLRGKRFSTTVKSLSSIKDTLFYKLSISLDFIITQNKEIFINRSPKMFPVILNYLRYKKISFDKLSKYRRELLRKEAEYYEIQSIIDYLDNLEKVEFLSIKYDKFIFQKYPFQGRDDLIVLKDKNLRTGICTNESGYIMIEFEEIVEFQEIEIAGYSGNSIIWPCERGKNAIISTSLDKIKIVVVGSIPEEFGDKIIKLKLEKTTAKYIIFTNNSYIGIGYLKIIKL